MMKNFTCSNLALKKLFTILLIGICASNAMAQLSGSYTINSAASTGGTNYQSFSDLSSDLISNGVSGPVKVYVVPGSGPYNEQVTFEEVPGASKVNTITIYGASETITFQGSYASMWTLAFNGADFFRINNLQIECTDAEYTWGVLFTNQADNNTMDSCLITCPNTSYISSSDYSAGIMFSSDPEYPSTGMNGFNNKFTNNTIKGTADGGFFFGVMELQNDWGDVSANQYINNRIEDMYQYGFFTVLASGNSYVRNHITRPDKTSSDWYYGFFASDCKDQLIDGNTIAHSFEQMQSTGNGIYGMQFQYIYGKNNRYINNAIINNNNDGPFYGIYCDEHSGNANVYHNTIQHENAIANNWVDYYGIHFTDYSGNGPTWKLFNNVYDFRNQGNGYYYIVELYSNGHSQDFNNNIWNIDLPNFKGSALAYDNWSIWGYYDYFSDAQANGEEPNSLEVVPQYEDLGADKIGLASMTQDNKGANVGVTKDITNSSRNATNPDIGAYELNINIKVTDVRLPNPNDCEAQQRAVTATIKNSSAIDLDNVEVQYRLDNGAYITEKYPNTIAAGAQVNFTFNTLLTLPAGSHYVYSNLNGRRDERDSFAVTVGQAPLGSYFKEGTPFNGTFNGGILLDPDVVANPDKIVYEVTNPTGYQNSGYGSTWEVQSLSFKEVTNGTNVPAADYKRTNASNSGPFTFEFTPGKPLTDKMYELRLIIYSHTTGCVAPVVNRFILVAPRPDAGFSAKGTCSGEKAIFTNNTTQTSGTTSYFWEFGDGTTSDFINPEHAYATPGSYAVKLTAISDRGYQDVSNFTLDIHANPTAAFTNTNACEGNAATFTNSSTTPNAGAMTYKWDFGDGGTSTQKDPQHTYTSLGEFPVKLIVTDASGCKDEVVRNMTHQANPDAAFTVNNGGVICTGGDAVFSNTSVNTGGVVGYEWEFGDGNSSVANDVTHRYANSGNFTVKLKARNDFGCVKEKTLNVSVVKGVLLSFNTTGNCNGDQVTFTNTSVEPAGAITYAWEFGDGGTSSDKSPKHTYGGSGKYHVKVQSITTAGCISTEESDVIVGEKPVAFFAINKDKICAGESINITNGSYVSDNSLTYAWDFGNGTSTDENPSVSYPLAGNYTIKLTVRTSTGCTDMISRAIKATTTPSTTFTTTSALHGDGSVRIIPGVSNGSGSYAWTLGDGNNSSSKVEFVHKFPRLGRFEVCLTRVDEGCQSSTCEEIIMNAASVKDIDGNSLLVYPNPSNGVFTLAIKGVAMNDAKIMVVNALGEVVYIGAPANLEAHTIDLSDKAAGIYVVKVMNGNQEFTQRISIVK